MGMLLSNVVMSHRGMSLFNVVMSQRGMLLFNAVSLYLLCMGVFHWVRIESNHPVTIDKYYANICHIEI